jgi:hypothetical protein
MGHESLPGVLCGGVGGEDGEQTPASFRTSRIPPECPLWYLVTPRPSSRMAMVRWRVSESDALGFGPVVVLAPIACRPKYVT